MKRIDEATWAMAVGPSPFHPTEELVDLGAMGIDRDLDREDFSLLDRLLPLELGCKCCGARRCDAGARA
jgi:hypothetical protein